VGLAQALLNAHKNNLTAIHITPSTGGVFEVKFNDELIFSKKDLGRFPEENEVENKVREKMQ
jgi:selenoprotein W-related protein